MDKNQREAEMHAYYSTMDLKHISQMIGWPLTALKDVWMNYRDQIRVKPPQFTSDQLKSFSKESKVMAAHMQENWKPLPFTDRASPYFSFFLFLGSYLGANYLSQQLGSETRMVTAGVIYLAGAISNHRLIFDLGSTLTGSSFHQPQIMLLGSVAGTLPLIQ